MKNTISSFIFIVMILMIITNSSYSQERPVVGIVTTFDSIPLINAKIEIKSSDEIVLTDTIGSFQINCLQKDKIKVSAHGFLSRNIKLDKNVQLMHINLKLKSSPKSREIAIGFGHVKDEEKLFAVSSLDNDDLDFSMYSDMYEVIRGRFSGVQVVGGDIIIRGINSITLSSSALIVVDGVASGGGILSSLSPSDVKSIDILKGTATAIYGVRGANGVVLIETKTGGDK